MSLPEKKQNAATDFSSDISFEEEKFTQILRHPETQRDSRNSKISIEIEAQNEDEASWLTKLPLSAYLKTVHDMAEKKYEDNDTWHSPCYFFAWFAKGYPKIRDFPSYKAAQVVEREMRKWNADPWATLFDHYDAEDARIDFMTSWDAIKYPAFLNPLDEALRLAVKNPLNPFSDRGKRYARLISITAQLHLMRRSEGSFFLGCRDAGKLLGCSHTIAASLLRFAVKDGFLKIIKASPEFKKSRRSEATEYKFVARLQEDMGKNDTERDIF